MTGFSTAEIPEGVLEKMASEQYEMRQDAYARLKKWSQENIKTSPESLHEAWHTSQDPEVKTRCFTLMKEVMIQRQFGKGKGFVGVQMSETTLPRKDGVKTRPGVRISMVIPNTPAQASGLAVNDVVVAIDKFDFRDLPKGQGMKSSVTAFSDYVQSKEAGGVVTLHIVRGGKLIEKKITLMKRPDYARLDSLGRDRGTEEKELDQAFGDWLKKMEKLEK
ncbi:MAG: PDZ domain-containing protein [Verrucomicrobiae bacterium]|nr:PDZ domain-containing protein [Verrucomicrobiae bacterium]NNJ42215.1 PDZ domain-containing protein [Akkermansiaceae bacterium]